MPPNEFPKITSTQTKPADEAQEILINGSKFFNTQLFKVFCPKNSFGDKRELAIKMFEHFFSELRELANENITVDRDKYYFELADVMFCAYGLLKMFNLFFDDADHVVYLCNNTGNYSKAGELAWMRKTEYEILKDISNNEITLPVKYAYACAQSNATKFFQISDKEAMLNNPAQFARDNNIELHSKNKFCFFTEGLIRKAGDIVNPPRKVLKYEKFGYQSKEKVLESLTLF